MNDVMPWEWSSVIYMITYFDICWIMIMVIHVERHIIEMIIWNGYDLWKCNYDIYIYGEWHECALAIECLTFVYDDDSVMSYNDI